MSDKESSSSVRKSSRLETEQLIREVRKRRCLWDRADPDYRNRVRKDLAWMEVIRRLEPKYDLMAREDQKELGTIITRKWNNVRDCYKKSRFGSSRSSAAGRPYIYADLLTFLNAVYDPAPRPDRDDHDDSATRTDHDDHEQEEEWMSEAFVDMEGGAQDSAPAAKRPRPDSEYPRPRDLFDADDGIVSVLLRLIEREEDEDRAFFKSITPAVRSLSREDKFLFRMEVMKLLDSFKNGPRPTVKREIDRPGSETD